MKIVCLLIVTLFSMGAFAKSTIKIPNFESEFSKKIFPGAKNFVQHIRKGKHSRVYCDFYADDNVTGYSLYRFRDDKDLGNAIFSDKSDCFAAADVANQARHGIVCSKYSNGENGVSYSVYRIRDNQDLGKVTISTFGECQDAVRYSLRNTFCSTFNNNDVTYWSPYSIKTGEDLGTKLYNNLDGCLEVL